MKNLLVKKFNMLLMLLGVSLVSLAQNVSIPDTNFKNALLANASINTVDDGEISVAEAEAFDGAMFVANQGITDMAGIEAFINLTQLTCNSNSLTSLDISSNTKLDLLRCGFNSSLGVVNTTNNTSLTVLDVALTGISTIDVSHLPLLTYLNVRANSLTTLNVNSNPLLTYISASSNDLMTIDLTSVPLLNALYLSSNQISTLDLSQNPSLQFFEITATLIASIDLSDFASLTYVNMRNMPNLTEVDIRNGNNLAITNFFTAGSSNLSCVAVDNVSYSVANWEADDTSVFAGYCDPNEPVNIPDANFKSALVGNSSINTNMDGEISYAEAEAFTSTMIVDNLSIADLTGIEAFTNMTSLFANGNDLTSVDVSANVELGLLNLNGNSLTDLDVGQNTKLTYLNVSSNLIETIDLQNLSLLQNLFLTGTGMISIDLSANPALLNLSLASNNLNALDISMNPALSTLSMANNDVASLDLSNNTTLTRIWLANNSLTSLDLSMNVMADDISVSGNALTSLNVANGNNSNVTSFDATNNPALQCVKVDDATYADANWTNIDAGLNFSDSYCDPNDPVNIPDENFKAALLANVTVNTADDGEISYSEAEAFTGKLSANALNIESLVGLEAFIYLTELEAFNNQIDEVDLSANTALTFINLSLNNLTSLDVSNLPDLELLSAFSNSITNTVDVSQNLNLQSLYLHSNDLSFIDLNENTELINLNVSNNDIEELYVDQLSLLRELSCGFNPLQGIDVSSNPDLRTLYIQSGSNDDFQELDLSNNPELRVLWAFSNNLMTLNMQNGANELIVAKTPTANFRISNNSLTCVRVDDEAYSDSEWTDIDEEVVFSDTYCTLDDPVHIPDANFKAALVADNTVNTNMDAEISYAEAEAYTGGITATSLNISNLMGVQAFTELTSLIVSFNDLTELDVSKNTKLRVLFVVNNQLSSLDVTANTMLTHLSVINNGMTELTLGTHPDLTDLYARTNDITSLDLTGLPNLDFLLVHSNPNLTSLNLSQNPNLTVVRVEDNNLSGLNLTNGNNASITNFSAVNNPNLNCVQVDDPAYSEANWTDIDEQTNFSLDCDAVIIPDAIFKNALLANTGINNVDDDRITFEEAEAFTGTISVQNMGISDLTGIEAFVNLTGLVAWTNNITEVDLSQNTGLVILELNSNPLGGLDITQLPLLKTLILNDAQVGDLDISNNTALEDVRLVATGMASISVTHLPNLKKLMVKENPNITSIDVTQNPQLEDFRFGSTGITNIDVSQNQQLSFIEMLASQVSELELSNHPNLSILDVRVSALSSINISNCPDLFALRVANTDIMEIDASANPILSQLDARSMPELSSLNVKNGNNTNFTIFQLTGSPNVTCVSVDDISYSETNWTEIESGVIFSTDCSNDATEIVSFSFPEQTSPAVIDALNHSISIEVAMGTNLTNLTPTIGLFSGAEITPLGVQDFSAQVTYTVTAEDRTTIQDWIVTVSVSPNTAPIVANSFADAFTTDEGFGSSQISYADVFSDEDGDELTISVTSSDENVVTVEIIENDQIQINEVGIGVSTITVTANDGNGGTISDTFTFIVNALILASSELEKFKVYPNPVQNQLTIQGANEPYNVRLFDLNGKTVLNGQNLEQLNLEGLEAGMYLLHLELSGGSTRVVRVSKNN